MVIRTCKAAQLMAGLGFMEHQNSFEVSEFSGGWRMRLNFSTHPDEVVRIIVTGRTEPTTLRFRCNFMVRRLVKAYAELNFDLHDRDFDAITNRIFVYRKSRTYIVANYSTFETTARNACKTTSV